VLLETTSKGNKFQVSTTRLQNANLPILVLNLDLNNFKLWPLRLLSANTKNLELSTSSNPFKILNTSIRSPQPRFWFLMLLVLNYVISDHRGGL